MANNSGGSSGLERIEPDLCVIGAGSGGLSVAAVAAAFGRSVVLIEKHKMGGDCLNYGCVPSKALIASGKRAHLMRTAEPFGIANVAPDIDHRRVHDHVKSVIAAIAPNDSVERFTGLGVTVLLGPARFTGKRTVVVGEREIKARRIIIATGSTPFVPPIPGLGNVPYFTNETIFDNKDKIEHLIVIGGGPIGMEMAQAHRRLGSKVTVLEGAKALGKDDPELAAIVLEKLRDEGLEIREGTLAEKVEASGSRIRVHVKAGPAQDVVEGTHLLLAVGRTPNISDLNLEAAGIKYDRRGITVGKNMKTSNSKVYAIGDVAGGLQFTHVANYHAGLVIRNALFRLPVAMDESIVPWCTFTEPELSHIGMTEQQARDQGLKINVLRWPYHENDRAQAERATGGHIKVITEKKGRILGATIVGEHAGELIQMWSLAMKNKLKIKAMTDWISPYPTLSEINKRAALRQYATAPSNPIVRKVVSLLSKFG